MILLYFLLFLTVEIVLPVEASEGQTAWTETGASAGPCCIVSRSSDDTLLTHAAFYEFSSESAVIVLCNYISFESFVIFLK